MLYEALLFLEFSKDLIYGKIQCYNGKYRKEEDV